MIGYRGASNTDHSAMTVYSRMRIGENTTSLKLVTSMSKFLLCLGAGQHV